MATPMRSQALDHAAAKLLAENGKWVKLSINELPQDGQALALAAMESECMARRAMDAFKTWANEKALVPTGMRRVYGLERGVTDPNMMADILYKDVQGSSANVVRGTWNSFTGAKA